MEGRNQATILFGILLASHSTLAQQASPPTLDEILIQLESNLLHYDTQIPNFFCSEHVVSLMLYGQKRQSTVTDSIFRLEHTLNPDQTTKLAESREIKTINGSPAEGKHINGPTILAGVFSGGLDAVSLSQKACMRYTLLPTKPGEPYIVQFATLPNNRHRSGCVLKEDGAGRVFIDPAIMQVTRMELTVPHHIIIPTEPGVWGISVGYSPVLLGGQTFWMPTTITSTATPNDAYYPTVWSFDAHYTNCHKLGVTSRILPFGTPVVP